MQRKRVTLKWRQMRETRWRAGPFIIVLSDRQYVYGVMEHGANALHTVRSLSEAKRACEKLASRILGAMK